MKGDGNWFFAIKREDAESEDECGKRVCEVVTSFIAYTIMYRRRRRNIYYTRCPISKVFMQPYDSY
jgi:hypothetical protein